MTCKKCGTENPDDFAYCGSCGATIKEPEPKPKPEPPAPKEESTPETKLCQHCRMEVPVAATACGHCGRSLRSSGFGVGCAVVTLVAGAVFFVLIYPPLGIALLVIGFVAALIVMLTRK